MPEISKIIEVNHHIDQSSSNVQFLLFTLLGDHVVPRGGEIWTTDLLYLLEVLGVGESSARSTLSRLAHQGWLTATKEGRRSQYALTKLGAALVEEGRKRIFEPPFADWDGRWQVVIYSLPESERSQREALRKQLAWLGFGRLMLGTWVSPHHRQHELETVFQELAVEEYVELFSGARPGLSSDEALIQRCWDLPGLAAEYEEFVAHYEQEYEQCRQQPADQLAAAPDLCFARRFWLTHDFQPFPRKDPNLPTSLLPPDWIGFKARQLFEDYRCLLAPYANRFVDELVSEQR